MTPTERPETKLGVWLREAANEIDNAHLTLDMLEEPRTSPDGTERTLARRISEMHDRLTAQ